VKTFTPGGGECSLPFYYEMLNGFPSYRLKEKKVKKLLPERRENGKRPLSYYDILKRLTAFPAYRLKEKK
jgi:hypothetical protein